jgi:hypothetical protein
VNILAIVLVSAWWLSGMAGFVFWWTREWAMEPFEYLVAVMAGILGPFSWLVGYGIHGRG